MNAIPLSLLLAFLAVAVAGLSGPAAAQVTKGATAKLAEGEMINCYVAKTDRLYKYTDGGGHKRTARVYRYLNERKGR